jgi:hypothetical protein
MHVPNLIYKHFSNAASAPVLDNEEMKIETFSYLFSTLHKMQNWRNGKEKLFFSLSLSSLFG